MKEKSHFFRKARNLTRLYGGGVVSYLPKYLIYAGFDLIRPPLDICQRPHFRKFSQFSRMH
jgi:hypothetical protein